MEQPNILITGGSGFIGTNLMAHFINYGQHVLNIDIATPKNEQHLPYWKQVDLLDFDSLKSAIESFNPDYIIHLAARTDLDGKTLQDYDANITGVKNLIQIVQSLRNIKKIIFTSSMLVCRVNYCPKNAFDYAPTTLYGESKVLTEKTIWENTIPCPWIIIRPTSLWGPWFGIPYRNFFDMVLSKRYVHIGNKSCTKTYGFIDNSIHQITTLLNELSDEMTGRIFYIGDYDPTNIEAWGNEIALELGYKIKKIPFFAVFVAARIGDVLKKFNIAFPLTTFRLNNMTTNNIVDLSDTKQVVPILPCSRKEGVQKTLTWLKTNKLDLSS